MPSPGEGGGLIPLPKGGVRGGHPPRQLIHERDEQHAEQHRRVAKGEITRAEQLPGDVDDQVVEWRVGVGGHDTLDENLIAQNLADGIAGALRRQPLVGPEAEGVEVMDAQSEAQQDERRQQDEHSDETPPVGFPAVGSHMGEL